MDELSLEQQLLTITSPETAEDYIKVIDLLDTIGVTTHIDTIEQHLGMTDYQSGNDFSNMIRDTLERQLTYELGRFTISLNPDIPYDLAFCTEVLRGMYHINDYPDGEAMLAALRTETDDVRESLFTVLSLINPVDEDEFFLQVSSVSPALLVRLSSTKEVLPEGITEETERLRNLIKGRARMVMDELKPYYEEFEGEVVSDAILHIENTPLGFDLKPTIGLLVLRVFTQSTIEAISDLALLSAASNISSPSKAFDILVNTYVADVGERGVLDHIAFCTALLIKAETLNG